MLQDVLTALRAGDPAAALATATRWSIAEPQNAEALYWLAQARGIAGDVPGASEALDRALALAPERADLLTLRAYLDLQGRDFAKAEAGLNQALAQDPNQVPAYIALAHLALARGDRAEAERLVAYAKRADADHPRVLLLEALLAARQEDQAERVLPLLMAAAERAPNDPLVLSTLGMAFFERGNFAFAVEALRRTLALSGASPALHGALIAALDAQGQVEEANAVADQWVQRQPGAVPAHWARAQRRLRDGQWQGAVDDLDAVLAAVPRHAKALEFRVQALETWKGRDAAREALEVRVATDPGFPVAWRLLLNLVPDAEVPALAQRWLATVPGDAAALDTAAVLAEREGRLGDALDFAEKALAAEPRLRESALLRARATALLDPEAAVNRMAALMASATTHEQARLMASWQGLAFHRAGRMDDALRAWGRYWKDGPELGAPLPNPEAADAATPGDDGGAGLLLWGPPGSRVERVHAALVGAAGERLAIDRFLPNGREDGFGLLRSPPGHPMAGTVARWRAPFAAIGRDPAAVIDALPFWDGWTHATLHGTTLVAVLRDPRDLLLNWMAWGSAMGFAFPSPSIATAWLHRVLGQLLDAEAAQPERVLRIDADLLERDPDAFAARLATVFGLASPPDLAMAQAMAVAANGSATDFPAGAWRQYAGPLEAPLKALGALAVRLGYPAE